MPARAETGDTTDALPGVVRVPVVDPSARGLAVAASAGYGYTESVLHNGDQYSRAAGSVAVSYQPVSYFAAALRLDARYDVDTSNSAAHGFTSDPRLELRAMTAGGEAFRFGAQVGVWTPGATSLSASARAITPDASVIATYAPPDSKLLASARLGFRWDNSAESVSNLAQIPLPDRVELGLNSANAVLTGLGATYAVTPRVTLLGDVTWDLLVGAAAPSVVDAPILVSAGVRSALDSDGKLELLGALTVSPSGRPTIEHVTPLIDIEPRVSVLLGLVFRPFAKRAVASAVIAPVVTGPEPTTLPPAAVAHARLKGRAVADDGVTPLAHALVVATPAGGGEKQQAETDGDGRFETGELEVGDVSLEITAPGFQPLKRIVTLSGTPAPFEVVVKHNLPAGEVRGVVRDLAGKPLKATVRIVPGAAAASATSAPVDVPLGNDGRFRTDVQPGSYDVVIRAPGYVDQKRHITVERDGVIMVDIELRKQSR